jgi:hypothetical protein
MVVLNVCGVYGVGQCECGLILAGGGGTWLVCATLTLLELGGAHGLNLGLEPANFTTLSFGFLVQAAIKTGQ